MPHTRGSPHFPAADRLFPQQHEAEFDVQNFGRPLRDAPENTFEAVGSDGADVLRNGMQRLHLPHMFLNALGHLLHGSRQKAELVV